MSFEDGSDEEENVLGLDIVWHHTFGLVDKARCLTFSLQELAVWLVQASLPEQLMQLGYVCLVPVLVNTGTGNYADFSPHCSLFKVSPPLASFPPLAFFFFFFS